MKRPAAAIVFLSMLELGSHEAAIRGWLVSEPGMGYKRLCTKMLSEKGCHVNPKTAQNYLTRLRREPMGSPDPSGHSSESDSARGYLSIAQLAEHEASIQEWLHMRREARRDFPPSPPLPSAFSSFHIHDHAMVMGMAMPWP